MRSLLTTLLLADAVHKYSPDQPRAANGEWGEGGSAAHADDIHGKLKAGLYQYDSKQARKPGYNPYAFSHYQDAAKQIRDEVAAGKSPRQSILEHFNDRLVNVALRSIGEPKVTPDEHRRHGY